MMDKVTLIAKRAEFFESILKALRLPPKKIDYILQQDKYYTPVDEDNTFYDAEAADLAVSIKGEFHGKIFNVYYSFWQLGDALKVGVAIYDEDLQGAFASDSHNEVFHIWGQKNDPRVDVAHNCVFYDWEFEAKDLYESYRNQEKYILGARHMHFRVMRILHDECERILHSKKKSNFNEDFSLQEWMNNEDMNKSDVIEDNFLDDENN